MNKSSTHTYRIALVVSLGGFIFGFDASVISGTVRFIMAEFQLTDIQLGLVVGAPTLGGIITAAIAGPLSDLYGRRTLLIAVASLYVVSAIMSAMAQSYEMLITARLIGGMAFASLSLAPLYISEIAAAHARGRMVSINQLNIVIGLSAAYFANYLVLKLAASDIAWVHSLGIADHTWRWMLGLEILPALLWLGSLMFVPESPRWLIINGREEQGRKVLKELQLDSDLEHEIDDIRHSSHAELASLSARLRNVLSPSLRLALMIGLILAVAQQITGINAIFFYAPSIFEQSGIGMDAAFVQAVAVGVINVVFTIISMLLIDRIGRRPLLIIGLTGIMLSMLLCAWSFQQAEYQLDAPALAALEDRELARQLEPMVDTSYHNDIAFKQALAEQIGSTRARTLESTLLQSATRIDASLVLIGILCFVASFAVSLGPVMWVMLPEIFPNQVRGVAMAVTGVVNSGISFGVQFIFPWQLNNLGAATTFLAYGVFAAFFLALTLWLVPETKNKTLEELELELTR